MADLVDNLCEVECPICHRRFKVITMTHLKVHGYPDKSNFIKDYPNAILVSKEYEESNRKLRSEIITKVNKSESQRNRASEHCKKLNQDSQRQSDKGRQGWTEERRQEKSIQIQEVTNKVNAAPEYREFRARRNAGLSYGKRHEYKTKDGRILSLKSFTECRTAKFLELNNFKFEYESIEVPYVAPWDSRVHKYFPDFYLPDYNLLIEVKPWNVQQDKVVLAKRDAAISLGYKFLFVSDGNLSRYKDLISTITALGAK